MIAQFIIKLSLMSLVLVSINSRAHSEIKECEKIRKLLLSGEFRNHSVPFTQQEPDYLEYEFDLDKNGIKDVVKAYCGNGADAVCEMILIMNDKDSFEFSLPATIRFLEIDEKIYIINGVTIYKNNKVKTKNYTVHQLFPSKIQLLCQKL